MRITRRYVPDAGVVDYVASWKHRRTMVSIEPKKALRVDRLVHE